MGTFSIEFSPPSPLYVKEPSGSRRILRKEHEIGAQWLQGAGLRPTKQRVALAALLIGDGQDRHVTAESLFDAAKTEGDSVSLATVYNTLRLSLIHI